MPTWNGDFFDQPTWDQAGQSGLAGALAGMNTSDGMSVVDMLSRGAVGFTAGRQGFLTQAAKAEEDRQVRNEQIANLRSEEAARQQQIDEQRRRVASTAAFAQREGINLTGDPTLDDEILRGYVRNKQAEAMQTQTGQKMQAVLGADFTGIPALDLELAKKKLGLGSASGEMTPYQQAELALSRRGADRADEAAQRAQDQQDFGRRSFFLNQEIAQQNADRSLFVDPANKDLGPQPYTEPNPPAGFDPMTVPVPPPPDRGFLTQEAFDPSQPPGAFMQPQDLPPEPTPSFTGAAQGGAPAAAPAPQPARELSRGFSPPPTIGKAKPSPPASLQNGAVPVPARLENPAALSDTGMTNLLTSLGVSPNRAKLIPPEYQDKIRQAWAAAKTSAERAALQRQLAGIFKMQGWAG